MYLLYNKTKSNIADNNKNKKEIISIDKKEINVKTKAYDKVVEIVENGNNTNIDKNKIKFRFI